MDASSSTAPEENDNNNNQSIIETTVMETDSNNGSEREHHDHISSVPTASNGAQSMVIQQCKSMEDASVSTTTVVESDVMMDAADDTRGVDGLPSEAVERNGDSPMKLTSSNEEQQQEEDDVLMMSTTSTSSPPHNAEEQQNAKHNSNTTNVSLNLTPEEQRLFTLLIHAAEAYERGELEIDPNPSERSVSARGGFTKAATATAATSAATGGNSTIKDDTTNNLNGDSSNNNNEQQEQAAPSWLKPPPKVNHIEIRIAGGWVRDKLLSQHSVDVDVALDCMMGVQFARIVQSYLAMEEGLMNVDNDNEHHEDDANRQKQVQQEVENDKPPSQRGHEKPKKKKKSNNSRRQPKIGVIGANPSQSKHLETATMNIHGIDVDFVNLRAEEVYEANSRIPTSQTRMFGTPLEDALRRDFTINSLFYNIRTGKVEDWTGRGLTDLLENRLIVTPVDPHETFHDDPLRVLRAIRFCVRLDFTLHEDIVQAAMSKRVHHSLHVKVSRERVGKELEGMLTGKHARPGQALDMIAELHLAGSVFAFPGSFPGDTGHVFGPVTGQILGVDYHGCCGKDGPEAVALAATHRARGWDESSALLALLPKVMESHINEREMFEDGNASAPPSAMDSRLLHICTFILPFHNLTFPDAKGRACSVTAHMIKEAVKWSVKDIQAVSKILQHVDEMVEILSEIRSQTFQQQQARDNGGPVQLSPPCRLRSGLLLRSLKEHWVTCLLTASALEMRSCQRIEEKKGCDDAIDELPSRHFYRAVVNDLDLDECWKVRPHLNGKEIIKELSLPKGPVVGVYIEDQTKWMLLNPKGSRDECMAHLVEKKRERDEEVVQEGKDDDDIVVDDQNVQNVGVANGDGKTSPDNKKDGSKHFSKKFRSDIDHEAEMTTNRQVTHE